MVGKAGHLPSQTALFAFAIFAMGLVQSVLFDTLGVILAGETGFLFTLHLGIYVWEGVTLAVIARVGRSALLVAALLSLPPVLSFLGIAMAGFPDMVQLPALITYLIAVCLLVAAQAPSAYDRR